MFCSLNSPWVQQTNYNLHPWYWNSLLFCLISSGENLAHFLQLLAFTIFQFFVPPGTHYWRVGRGSMEWEVCLTFSTHDQLWELNPKPSQTKLKFNALSTWPHAPMSDRPVASISRCCAVIQGRWPSSTRLHQTATHYMCI